ncbi:virulence protein [Agrobacterium tumefaciens]|uniref:virulence protein n=1 Tax=Agrobacterium tumefaciens TaxID=358 RepID=UPI0015728E32|nr:virulence protein [Agrobacterium tumefaciens]WCK69398.1 virulence protein [Agrobacterium tumefaciens]
MRNSSLRDASGSNDAQVPHKTELLNLPDHVLTEVAKRLATNNPVESAENIANFSKSHRLTRDAVRTEPLEKFSSRLKILSRNAKLLTHAVGHAATLPDGEQLSEAQLSQMRNEVAVRPVLGLAYTHQDGQPEERLSGNHLDRKINDIPDLVFNIAEPIMFNEISALEVMAEVRPIARSIKEAHDDARAELMSADRPRSTRGL